METQGITKKKKPQCPTCGRFLNNDVVALREQINQINADKQRIESELKMALNSVDNLTAKTKRQCKHIEELKAAIAKYKEQLGKLKTVKIGEAQPCINNFRTENEHLKMDNDDLRQGNIDLATKLKSERDRNSQLTDVIKDKNKELKVREAYIDFLLARPLWNRIRNSR